MSDSWDNEFNVQVRWFDESYLMLTRRELNSSRTVTTTKQRNS